MNTVSLDPSADFDFQFGDWIVHHRRLDRRLCGSDEWTQFGGSASVRPILGGLGNLEDNELVLPEGPYRAIALRSYDSVKRQWAIWWLDGRRPHALDVPVVGEFKGRIGFFFADDVLDSRPVKVRFSWDARVPAAPIWEQAFSADAGTTWETNWIMRFERAQEAVGLGT